MAKTTGYAGAADGLPARISGPWAREKLYYVERYFTIFNKGMKFKWPSRVYADLMAGPGRCITEDGDEFEGSPLLALKSEPPFQRSVLVESNDELLGALRARTEAYRDRALVLPGDCNDPTVITRIRKELPASSLGLVFIDMLGLDVSFGTISALTMARKMDLVITLQVNDLTRNAESAADDQHDPTRFDRFFGDPGWRDVIREWRRRGGTSPDLATALTSFYVERLETIGYPHVAELHVLMKNTKKAPLYRLVLAARHERATEFFRAISKIEYSGQRGLL